MMINSLRTYTVLLTVLLLPVVFCRAQTTTVKQPDLTKLGEHKKLKVINREMSLLKDAAYTNGIHLSEKPGAGLLWLPKTNFSNGTIEFDIKGKDVMQQSFVGIAFHGINDSTYDAVYFRPFNFSATDSVRKRHAVQYISMPSHDWPSLRSNYPNVYEDSIIAAPAANDWFHVSIVLQTPNVSVYVNRNPKPSLVVEKLSKHKEGMIGFWVGNNSDGDFANLKMTEMEE